MADDPYLIRVAGELADLALADQEASGDINIVDTIGKVLGSSSQTLEEAFLTAVRVRRAEARARALLADRAASGYANASRPSEDQVITPDAPEEDTPEEVAEVAEAPNATAPARPSGMPRRVNR